MLFNSGVFLQFFAAFLLLYWMSRGSLRWRNILIVLASFLFYAWWTPPGSSAENSHPLWQALYQLRFLGLLLATSLFDFSIGLALEKIRAPNRRKLLIALSICANLGVLAFFKYANFFSEAVGSAFSGIGWNISPGTWSWILPVGISFYTFQSMSYPIDIYRGQIRATSNPVEFLAFVSFFPQLVAGPIERASHLLPQFRQSLVITWACVEEGLWLIIWGLFKKVVVADNLAPLVEMVFDQGEYSALAIGAGTLAFALQIYGDFSGYSDIARGTARVLGFDIMWNFNLPYTATDLRDFWRRWHISLSTWLRDYLYISLGGNQRGTGRTYLNLFITMLLGGLWHGAAWNFIIWGAWHGVGLAWHRFMARTFPGKTPAAVGWVFTMAFILYGWLIFRAHSLEQIAEMTRGLANFSAPSWIGSYLLNLLVYASPLLLMEAWQRRRKDLLAVLRLPVWGRTVLQGILVLAIAVFWQREKVPFIYFQF